MYIVRTVNIIAFIIIVNNEVLFLNLFSV